MVNDILLIISDSKLRAQLRNMLVNQDASFRFLDESSAGHLGLEKAYLLNPDIIITEALMTMHSGYQIAQKLYDKSYFCRIILIGDQNANSETAHQLPNIIDIIHKDDISEKRLHDSLTKAADWNVTDKANSRKSLFLDIMNCESNTDFAILNEKYAKSMSVNEPFHLITIFSNDSIFLKNSLILEHLEKTLHTIGIESKSLAILDNNFIYIIINNSKIEKNIYGFLYEFALKAMPVSFSFLVLKPVLGVNELKDKLAEASSINKYAFFCKHIGILEESIVQQKKEVIPNSIIISCIDKIRRDIVEMDEFSLIKDIKHLFLAVLKHKFDLDAYNYACDKLEKLYNDFLSTLISPEQSAFMPGNNMYIEDVSEQIVNRFKNIFHKLYPNIMSNQLIQNAVSYIREHFASELSLAEVANHMHISTPYLSSLFKKHLGVNFADYLSLIRLNRAKEYIQENRYKVYEIADMVGFNDAKYFSKLFRKNTGLTPKEYKDSLLFYN